MPDLLLDATLRRELSELPALLGAIETVEQTLGRIAELCGRAVPGCLGAAVSLRAGTMWADVAVPEWLGAVDHDQYAAGVGPCVDAVRTGAPVLVGDMATEGRWGSFGTVAVQYGVGSAMAVPLGVRARVVGALGLYAAEPHVFDDVSTEVTRVLAGQAGAALVNTEIYDASRRRADGLATAMASRAAIEQAKGVLMGREGCSAQEAFDLLRQVSQTQHLKLHDVAQRLLTSVRGQRSPQGRPQSGGVV